MTETETDRMDIGLEPHTRLGSRGGHGTRRSYCKGK